MVVLLFVHVGLFFELIKSHNAFFAALSHQLLTHDLPSSPSVCAFTYRQLMKVFFRNTFGPISYFFLNWDIILSINDTTFSQPFMYFLSLFFIAYIPYWQSVLITMYLTFVNVLLFKAYSALAIHFISASCGCLASFSAPDCIIFP